MMQEGQQNRKASHSLPPEGREEAPLLPVPIQKRIFSQFLQHFADNQLTHPFSWSPPFLHVVTFNKRTFLLHKNVTFRRDRLQIKKKFSKKTFRAIKINEIKFLNKQHTQGILWCKSGK